MIISKLHKPLATAILASGLGMMSIAAMAQDLSDGFMIVKTQSDYAGAVQDLENAIINQGLVIDYQGQVGAMLQRTQDDVGAKTPYTNASYLQFCSAPLTHAAVAADPRNMAICPYVVFVYEVAGEEGAMIGYRRPVGAEGEASRAAIVQIEAMLEAIVSEAAEGL